MELLKWRALERLLKGPDPQDRTTIAFLELNKNDFVTVTVDRAGGATTFKCDLGTSIAIYRYFGFFKTEDTLASGLISNDFTINTFSQDNLSVQYERSVEQVPFRLGVRGVATIRGKNTVSSVPKIGNKKN